MADRNPYSVILEEEDDAPLSTSQPLGSTSSNTAFSSSPEKNPFADLLEEGRREETSRALTNVRKASDKSPKQHAEIRRLAREVGAPEAIVSLDPETYDGRVAQRRMIEAVEGRPALLEYFKTNDAAKLARDDLLALRDIYDHMRSFRAVERQGGVVGTALDIYGRFKTLTGGVLQSVGEAPLNIKEGMEDEVVALAKTEAMGLAEAARRLDALVPEGEIPDNVVTTMGQQLAREGRALSELEGPHFAPGTPAYWAYGALTAGVEMLPSILVSIVTKNPGLGLSMMGTQAYGHRYNEARLRGAAPDEARIEAGFFGLLEIVSERLPLKILMEHSGGVLKRSLKSVRAEALQEMFVEAVDIGYGYGVLNEDMTLVEAFGRLVDAGIIGGLVGGGLSIVTSPFNRSTPDVNQILRDRAGADAASVWQIVDRVQATKLASLSPEEAKVAVDTLSEETDLDEVYFDPIGLLTYFQSVGADGGAMLEAMGVTEQDLNDAADTGGSVAVQISTLSLTPELNEHRAGLTPYIKLKYDGLSQADLDLVESLQSGQTSAHLLAGFIAGEDALQAAEGDTSQAVFDDVFQALVDTGRHTPSEARVLATIQKSIFRTLAAKVEGRDALSLYRQSAVGIQGLTFAEFKARRDGEGISMVQRVEAFGAELDNVINFMGTGGGEFAIDDVADMLSEMEEVATVLDLGNQDDPFIIEAREALANIRAAAASGEFGDIAQQLRDLREALGPTQQDEFEDLDFGDGAFLQSAATHPFSEFIAPAAGKTLDELYANAEANTAQLHAALTEAAARLAHLPNVEPILVPPKDRARAEEKMAAKRYVRAGQLMDVVRSGIVLETVEGSGTVLTTLIEIFGEENVYDEGWTAHPDLYTDRKALVRFSDGVVAEVQIRTRAIHEAKMRRGEALYMAARVLPPADPRATELTRQMQELYGAALAESGAEMIGIVFGSEFGNILENVLSETSVPLSATSATFTASQDPSGDTTAYAAAKSPTITAGRASQSTNVNLSTIRDRVGAAGRAVNRATRTTLRRLARAHDVRPPPSGQTSLFQMPKAADITIEQNIAFERFLDTRADGDEIRAQLKKHAGSPWMDQAVYGGLTRMHLEDLIAGREVNYASALSNPRYPGLAKAAAQGAEAVWGYLDVNSMIGNASKPVNTINSTFTNCRPSLDCAKFCYATKGNYRYDGTVFKAEAIGWAIDTDPVRAAQLAARQYKATAEFHTKKALRLLDKGDLGPQWIPFVKELNKQGVRLQVFSKRPELLRQIPEMNLRLLSVDDSNSKEMAENNPDLDLAVVYLGKQDVPFLEKYADRVQVILPVKIGRNVMSPEETAPIPQKLRRYICPIDGAKKKIGTLRDGNWNCTRCDKNGGVGCFHGKATAAVLDNLKKDIHNAPDDLTARVDELRTLAEELEGDARQLLLGRLDLLVSAIRRGVDLEKEDGVISGLEEEADVADASGGDFFQQRPAAVDTPAFKAWFKDSEIVDEKGDPRVLYHGTKRDISGGFQARFSDGLSFFTFNPDFAERWATGTGGLREPSVETAADVAEARAHQTTLFNEEYARIVGAGTKVLDASLDDIEAVTNAVRERFMERYAPFRSPMDMESRADVRILPVYLSVQKLFDPARDASLIEDVLIANGFSETVERGDHKGGNYLIYENEPVVNRLKELGFDGMLLRESPFDDPHTVAVFEPTQIKSTFNEGAFDPTDADILRQTQRGPDEPKGAFSISQDRATRIINLFEGADQSTFLHEMSHAYLELLRDLHGTAGAEALDADIAAIFRHLDVKSFDGIGTEQQEIFAETWEKYLYTGEAPTQELKGAFARIKRWMVSIYESIQNIGVTDKAIVTPEIKAVMDRMLATETEIARAETEGQSATHLVDDPNVGLTDAELDRLNALKARAADTARARMLKQLMADITHERTEEFKAAVEAEKDRVEAEMSKIPVWMVLAHLRDGVAIGSDAEPQATTKLDATQALEILGEADVANLPQDILATDEGADIEQVAESFGFANGTQMLYSILETAVLGEGTVTYLSTDEVIEREARGRVQEKIGDGLNQNRIRDEAAQAVTNEDLGEALILEMTILRRLSNEPGARESVNISQAVVRELARRRVGEMTVDEMGRLSHFSQDALRASKAVEAALIKKDYVSAQRAKWQQVWNHFMFIEAKKAEAKQKAAMKRLRRYAKISNFRKSAIDNEYLGRIQRLLDAYNIGPGKQSPEAAREGLSDMEAWVETRNADGDQIAVAPSIWDAKDITRVTHDELVALDDAVKSLNKNGRDNSADAKKAFRKFVKELAQGMEANAPKIKNRKEYETIGQRAEDAAGFFFGGHRKVSHLMRELDGFDDLGPLFQAVFRPIADAASRELKMRTEAHAALTELWSRLDGRMGFGPRNEKFTVGGRTVTKEQIRALALNWGTETNRDALLNGARPWTEEEIFASFAHLDATEWDFIEATWEMINGYWPLIAELETRMTGAAPPKVQAAPFTLPNGRVISGGYYPIAFDPTRSDKAKRDEATAALAGELRAGTWGRAATAHGHTIGRVGSKDKAVKLSTDVMFRHLDQVIHDLTHREAVVGVHKIISSDIFRSALRNVKGIHAPKYVDSWLLHVAGGDMVEMGPIDPLLRHARIGISIAEMGFSLRTFMVQPAGMTQSVARLGAGRIAAGIARFYAHPFENMRDIKALSSVMSTRASNWDRNLADANRHLRPDNWVDQIRSGSFFLIAKADLSVVFPTWLTAYRQGVDENGWDQADAVAYADSVVEETQGSGSPKDLPAVQRGGEGSKMFTSFLTFFIAYQQMLTDATKITQKRAREQGIMNASVYGAAQFFWLIALPALGTAWVLDGGPEDDEEWWRWTGKELARYSLGGLIGVREVAGAAFGDFPFQGPASLKVWKELTNTITQFQQGEVDRQLARSAIMTTGYLGHLPGRQTWRLLEAYLDYLDDKPAIEVGASLAGLRHFKD